MSLTNPNKPVTEARLQEFYHRIKSYLGFTEMPSEDMDEVISPLPSVQSRYHKYSTEEQIVGEWIDGSTIYEKTFALDNITGTTAGTFKVISTDISALGIDFVVDYRGIIRSEASFQIIDYRENNGGQQLKLQVSTTSLQLVTNMAIDGFKYWVTIQYTKSE